ncbi:DUF2326 domain-containing protein [Chitinophaga oryziterrae]|uniref:DUF2326 domain-containing protein n=1 Tax=Chitinophaga oryziterrae TaxID=1031224 RepID=A0A6N8JG93_9BACT|nr:DUF2326 domain-containing protein [Chitinophaga oryziterrae]MVT44335.1 DUF2326 domain-containing protein [Chitinophaga oryziterrae]
MLTRLHSETNLLVQNITFEPGINIIYGKYSGSKEARGINGIGKSSLVRLINFMLLSDSAEREFNKPKYNFLRDENHSLTLEFKIDNNPYFVRRHFNDVEVIYFGSDILQLAEYSKSELLLVFSSLLFPVENNEVYIEGNRFRTLMQFFIKDDIQNKGRKDATNFFSFTPSAADKAAYNFYLLGLPTKNILSFNEISKEYKKYSEALNTYEEKLRNEGGHTVEEYRSEKLRIKANIDTLRSRLKGYDFKESHKEVEKQLSDVISKINDKSQEFHSLSQKLKNIKESYQLSYDIDTKHIRKIYNEVLETFGDAVKKTLDEVNQFKADILGNRNKFLVNKEKELQASIDAVFKQLSILEAERTKLLKTLHERGVLDKLESTYEELMKEQASFEKQNQILIQVDEFNRILSDQEIVLSQVKKDISDDVSKAENSLNELRQLFIEILNSAIFMGDEDASGYFDVAIDHKSKKTSLPFKIDVNIPKSSSVGQEVLKIIAYDLMIFINSITNKRALPDFLIHDGVFHGMSHKTMVNILNYIYRTHLTLYEKKNFQYIVTFSEDEIEVPIDKKDLYGEFAFPFSDKKIIELEDIESKMLFKRDIR